MLFGAVLLLKGETRMLRASGYSCALAACLLWIVACGGDPKQVQTPPQEAPATVEGDWGELEQNDGRQDVSDEIGKALSASSANNDAREAPDEH